MEKKKMVAFRFDPSTIAKLHETAQAMGVTQTAVLESLVHGVKISVTIQAPTPKGKQQKEVTK